jgi:hypothetical protein
MPQWYGRRTAAGAIAAGADTNRGDSARPPVAGGDDAAGALIG